MKNFLWKLPALALLAFAGTASAETVELRFGGRAFFEGDRVHLKQELRNQGVNPENYNLRSITIVAEGQGALGLWVGDREVDHKRLRRDGTPRNGAFQVTLYGNVRERLERGPWQLIFSERANMNVRRVIIDIQRDNGGGWNPPPPPPRNRVYTERLESLGGGFLNAKWDAPRGEMVVNVRLVRQHSSNACDLGRGFGFSRYQVWVDRGCRGTFEIETTFDRR